MNERFYIKINSSPFITQFLCSIGRKNPLETLENYFERKSITFFNNTLIQSKRLCFCERMCIDMLRQRNLSLFIINATSLLILMNEDVNLNELKQWCFRISWCEELRKFLMRWSKNDIYRKNDWNVLENVTLIYTQCVINVTFTNIL